MGGHTDLFCWVFPWAFAKDSLRISLANCSTAYEEIDNIQHWHVKNATFSILTESKKKTNKSRMSKKNKNKKNLDLSWILFTKTE